MKAIKVPNGIVHLVESKAACPHCTYEIPFDVLENRWMKQNNAWFRYKCLCKRFIGITTDFHGDFIAFELN